MTNYIPIFPLGIVVYPSENLNLHIFEQRYKQLITECFAAKKPFGIPTVVDNKMQEFGTVVKVVEISKQYEGGEMDIKTKGLQLFRILEIIKEIPDKLYGGAIVNYTPNNERPNPAVMRKLLVEVRQLHQLLQVNKDFKKPDEELLAYDIAHHIGLSLQEEYELLNLLEERQRLEYLKRHLAKAIPMLNTMEQLKEKIQLNGHFKNLSGFDIWG
ncbi:MAG: hypothetical protein RL115_1338 [Bacteroidota bacterium]|jgi:Lon protease-like protein